MPGKVMNKNAWRRQKAKEKAAAKPAADENPQKKEKDEVKGGEEAGGLERQTAIPTITITGPNGEVDVNGGALAPDPLKPELDETPSQPGKSAEHLPVKDPAQDDSISATVDKTVDTETNGHIDDLPANAEDEEMAEDLGPAISADDPLFKQFRNVFKKFGQDVPVDETEDPDKPTVFFEGDNVQDEEEEANMRKKLSKKAKRKAEQLTVAQLKSRVPRPELVEWTDVHALQPVMLVSIKANRNIVPVPGHWTTKREFLSAKRGIEKKPFALPQFIIDTGITATRDAELNNRANMSLKQQQRERVQGKTGKLDLDYQKMHDAFFKHQAKPGLTRYGDLYYEGREWEVNLKHLRPGRYSEELREALGMAPNGPPPWLLNMQRHGPPPSYPGMKIPGLSAPIPPGATWGYQQGGWGKPPVDEYNRPMFDETVPGEPLPVPEKPKEPKIDTSIWGELEPPQESEDEEPIEEDDDEEEDEEEEDADIPVPQSASRRGSRASFTYSSGAPTPAAAGEPIDHMDPGRWYDRPQHHNGRPIKAEPEPEQSSGRRSLYTVVPETATRPGESFRGSSMRYDVKGAEKAFAAPVLGAEERGTKRKAGDVDVSVDLDALGKNGKLSKQDLRRQYEESAEVKKAKNPWADMNMDLDDMIREESSKQMKNDEERSKRRKLNKR